MGKYGATRRNLIFVKFRNEKRRKDLRLFFMIIRIVLDFGFDKLPLTSVSGTVNIERYDFSQNK